MLLDTSGLMCLFDRREDRHEKAIGLYSSAVRLICHNYVLAEFVALAIARRVPMTQALQFTKAIAQSAEIEVHWIDRVIHDRTLQLLVERADKAWSLCDAVSFIIMTDRGISEALTTDHNFEQAAFIRLLS